MPLISCKVHLELNWIEDCILPSDKDSAKFKITDAKLHVPIVTLSTKENVNLPKQLSEGFEISVYWNSYQTKPANVIEKRKNLNYLMHHFKALEDFVLFRLLHLAFVLAYVAAAGAANDEAGIKSNEKYFLPEWLKIKN